MAVITFTRGTTADDNIHLARAQTTMLMAMFPSIITLNFDPFRDDISRLIGYV
jgi:hypothetical protein